jgi:hypothetical protein
MMFSGNQIIPRFILLVSLAFFPLNAGAQSIALNEVMASNSVTLTDQDGDYEDWIELFNYGSEPVNLEGFGLSDNYDDPFRWVFPRVIIEPAEFLLVWASGKDRRPEAGWINGVMREVWKGIPGTSVDDLVSHPDYPASPHERHLVTGGFEAPVNTGDYYGQRMHGFIEAPVTGSYIFWISSDDNGRLYLSTSEEPENIVLIASVPGWTNPREWNKYPEQRSEPVFLEEGNRYYIKALMKEHGGGDNLAVRWRLPSGVTEEPIPSSRLFWNETELHTNFRISWEGEEILLTGPDSSRIDEIAPTIIPADISWGRYPDGTGEFYYFIAPTPGEPNHEDGRTELPVAPEPPEFSHKGGPYTADFQLSFEFRDGLEVYYTLDGSTPRPGVSNRYSTPVRISETRVVKAVSHEPGGSSSRVVNEVYTRLSNASNLFNSNLPLMVLHQFNTGITAGGRTPAYITLFRQGEDGRTRLASDPVLQSRAMVNIRGSSSQMFPKKMYGFHLVEEDGSNRSEELLGMPREHNWILNGPYSDKSLMRNVIAYGLSNDIGRYAPRTRFVELFLHDGNGLLTNDHYHGVYVLIERIKWGDDRVDIDKPGPDENQEPGVTGGYIFKRDRPSPGESGFRTDRGSRFEFVRPDEQDITLEQREWLERYVSDFETALFASNFNDPAVGYNKYIDPDTFIDAHLITELLKEIDGYRLSTFFYMDREGRINKGPLWDFNISMGNVDYYPDPGFTSNAPFKPWEPEGWYYDLLSDQVYLYGWYLRLFADPQFSARYRERYWQLRRGQFSTDSLRKRINKNAFILNESQDRNFKRWPILNRYVWPNWYIAPTYNHEISWITEWIGARTRWMDRQLGPSTSLIHFWHFNDLPSGEFYTAGADHTSGSAMITYSGSGDGFMDRVNDGTLINSDLGETAGLALRVRNPSAGRELVFSLPSTGYRDLVFRYMAKRTPNGPRQQTFYYRTDDADPWIRFGDTLMITESYQQFRFNFAGNQNVDDNPLFSVRILFHGEGTEGTSGNNRFDNITLDGYSLSGNDTTGGNGNNPLGRVRVFHNNSLMHVDNPTGGTVHVEVFTMTGRLAARHIIQGTGWHTFPFSSPQGVYIVRMVKGDYVFSVKVPVH